MKRKGMKNLLLLLVCISVLLCNWNIPQVNASTTQTIKVKVTHPGANMIKLQWSKISNAKGYHIYIASQKEGAYRLIKDTTKTSVVLGNFTTNSTYYIKVQAYTVQSSVETKLGESNIITATPNVLGIDVSKWQGTIDWEKVKNTGIQYVMIRAGASDISTGTLKLVEDSKYEANIKGATEAGLAVGVYWTSKAATTEQAKTEANYVLSLVKGYTLSYPITIDVEPDNGVHNKLTINQNCTIIKAFCNVINQAGYESMFYTNYNMFTTKFDYNQLSSYNLWIARYATALNLGNPVHMWQFSSEGKLDGITENTVDFNYVYDEKETTTGVETANYKATLTEKPVVIAKSAECQTIKLSWQETIGAEGYLVYAKESGGSYKLVAKTTAHTYQYKGLTPGKTYYIQVAAYQKNNGVTSKVNSATVSCKVAVPAVTGVKATAATYQSNQITWSKVTGATGYYVYYKTSTTKSFTSKQRVKVTTNQFVHQNLKTGTTYNYKVVAYCSANGGSSTSVKSSAMVSAKPMLAKPVISSAVAGKQTIKLSWKKVSGSSGYEISRSTKKSSSYQKVKTITNGTTISYANTGLKRTTTYYYKIRAYRIVSGKKVYSNYSSVLGIKTK